MNELLATDHPTIVELLPDHALGRLDDATADRVERHLQGCRECQEAFAVALDALGALAAAPPPPDWVRSAVLWRATQAPPLALGAGASAAADDAVADDAVADDAPPGPPGRSPFGKPLPRLALIAASLVVMAVGSLTVWNYELRSGIDTHDRIYALVSNPAAAHPLQSSMVSPSVAGVVFAEPQSHDVYLVASGLPALPADKRYQVWLFPDDGKPISGGLLSVGADGDARTLFETPQPFSDYFAVALSAEPQAGSPAPTSALTLGGSLNTSN